MPVSKRLRHEDYKFKASLGYTQDPISKQNNNNKL
jgi:hypothetical protein